MARRRPRTAGNHYEKRPSRSQTPPAPAPPGAGLTGPDARLLADRIATTQQRYRIVAIRLLQARTCGVVVVDSQTGREYVLQESDHWNRLLAG